MQSDNLIKATVGVAIGVLLLVTLALPIISSATETEATLTNEGIFKMNTATVDDEDITITWEYATPFIFDVNGAEVSLPEENTIIHYSLVCTEDWTLRFRAWNNGNGYELTVWTASQAASVWTINSGSPANATVTLSAGTASFVKGTSDPVTLSYTEAYYLDAEGAYVMKNSSETAYLLEDSVIYSTGRSDATVNGSTVGAVFHLEGTIKDGITATVIYPPSGLTTANIQIVKTDADGYIGVYNFEKVTLDATDGTDTTALTYGQVIVPYQITAEKAVHFSDAEITMLELIPLLLAVALVLGVIGYAIRARLS